MAAVLVGSPLAQTAGPDESATARKMASLVNQARAEPRRCGAKYFAPSRPLIWNDTLARVARAHAEDMARQNRMSHGDDPAERVERAGYNYRSIAENVATGQRSPEAAIASWISSPPHCANLMDPAYVETGAAFAVNANGTGAYWAQMFGTRLK